MHNLIIDRELQKQGWCPSYDPISEIWGCRIFTKGNRTVASVESDQSSIPDYLTDGHFERIRDILKSSLGTISDVIFRGGGTVNIPVWFREWCKTHGISIHVLDYDDALPNNLIEKTNSKDAADRLGYK